jgi:CheY-like chemotaxis protein
MQILKSLSPFLGKFAKYRCCVRNRTRGKAIVLELLGPERTRDPIRDVRSVQRRAEARHLGSHMQKSRNGPDPLVVLVVEDEFLVRLDVAEYLRDAGYVVLEAWSADKAVAMCRDDMTVDVLLTDINLGSPGTGWQIAKEFRTAQPGAGVIYVSGNSVTSTANFKSSMYP